MPLGKRNARVHSCLNWDPAFGLSLLHTHEESLHTQTCTGSRKEKEAVKPTSSSINVASCHTCSYSFTSFLNTFRAPNLGGPCATYQGKRVEKTQLWTHYSCKTRAGGCSRSRTGKVSWNPGSGRNWQSGGNRGVVKAMAQWLFQRMHQCGGSKEHGPLWEVQSGLTVVAQSTWAWKAGSRRSARMGHTGPCIAGGCGFRLTKKSHQKLLCRLRFFNKHLKNLYFRGVYRVKESTYTELHWLGKSSKMMHLKLF